MLEAAIIINYKRHSVLSNCMTFDMITMYFTSSSLPSKPYNQYTGLGLRQPLLMTMKTLPNTAFKIK